MLGKNQNQSQTAAEGATAIQTTGNVHLNQGYTLAEVERLFGLLLQENFPKLETAAKSAARENVRQFAQTFTDEIKKETDKIFIDKLAQPDVQAALNDAVQACARRGNEASPETLSKLLVHRMGENTPFLDMVLNEAILAVPRLSKEQVAFLVYVHVTRAVFLTSPSYPTMQHVAASVLPIISPGFGLSGAQKKHMQYVGVLSIQPMMGGDVYEKVLPHFSKGLGLNSADEFKKSIKVHCPAYSLLLEKFAENELFQAELTSVGIAIAVTLIKPMMNVDFSMWLS